MARIVYSKVNGIAEVVWFAKSDYTLKANEFEMQGTRLPTLEELSDRPTAAQQAAALEAALTLVVQQHLDAAAKSRGYDNIFTAVTYADEPAVPTFQAEGAEFRRWRSVVWGYCYQVMTAVQAGVRSAPTEAELINELQLNCPLNLP